MVYVVFCNCVFLQEYMGQLCNTNKAFSIFIVIFLTNDETDYNIIFLQYTKCSKVMRDVDEINNITLDLDSKIVQDQDYS